MRIISMQFRSSLWNRRNERKDEYGFTTDEIRMLCNAHKDFKITLETSLAVPMQLNKEVFWKVITKSG